MGWVEEFYEELVNETNSNPFRAKEIIHQLGGKNGYSPSQVYKALELLEKEGKIARIYQGVYDFNVNDEPKTRDAYAKKTDYIKKVEDILNEKGIEYMLTGPSLLIKYFHHLPRRNIHLIYLIKGSGEYVLTTLLDENIDAILNPDKNTLRNYLTHYYENDVVILREFNNLDGNQNGTAIIERAVIDTYFESTRGRIPLSPRETGRIIKNLLEENTLNYNLLLKYSWKRGINTEIKKIIKEHRPSFPLKSYNINNKFSYEVIQGMRE